MKALPFLLILCSCGSMFRGNPKMGRSTFQFQDVSGSYRMVRESKIINKKLVSRIQLYSTAGGGEKLVEKTISVSQPGSVKGKGGRMSVLRPLASEFKVWLEGKEYYSKQNLNAAQKSMKVTMRSPETKLNGIQNVRFPQGRFFCYFSQLPECLYQSQLLEIASNEQGRRKNFYVVWDSFPYTREQFSNVGGALFAPASLKYDAVVKGNHRFEVELEGQLILYYFSKSYDFVKMSWIAQGLTISNGDDDQFGEE